MAMTKAYVELVLALVETAPPRANDRLWLALDAAILELRGELSETLAEVLDQASETWADKDKTAGVMRTINRAQALAHCLPQVIDEALPLADEVVEVVGNAKP